MTRAVGPRACALLAPLALFFAGCTGPDDPTERLRVPSSARFELVSGVLALRCGSLDCHGQQGRSLRIYSATGLRLSPDSFPSLDAGATTDAEVLANYRSTVALEPELLALVFAEHGKDPERLTLVRKARGSENHKGGAAIALGSAADSCILSWLSAAIDEAACTDGALEPRPDAGAAE